MRRAVVALAVSAIVGAYLLLMIGLGIDIVVGRERAPFDLRQGLRFTSTYLIFAGVVLAAVARIVDSIRGHKHR